MFLQVDAEGPVIVEEGVPGGEPDAAGDDKQVRTSPVFLL